MQNIVNILTFWGIFLQILPVYLVIINCLTFALFGEDKNKAKRHKWRIAEKDLIICEFLGGALGGLIGMFVFHHKTKHPKFYISAVLGLIIWGGIIYYIYP